MNTRGRLAADSQRRYDTALALFEPHVDTEELTCSLGVARATVVTPLMFEYGLIERARAERKHIVLPEGDDDRVLRAAATLLKRGIADLTILGEEIEVRSRAHRARPRHPRRPHPQPLRSRSRDSSPEYARLRAHKGMTSSSPRHRHRCVVLRHDDGAPGPRRRHGLGCRAHDRAHHPPGVRDHQDQAGRLGRLERLPHGLADRVLVYGDCAVMPDPTAEQLADIAISSAATARSSASSPASPCCRTRRGSRARAPTSRRCGRRRRWCASGARAAGGGSDPVRCRRRCRGGRGEDARIGVAGRATVFVFPDLNTGNNTYKAVQRWRAPSPSDPCCRA